jgi:hypothetical protein
MKFAKLVFLIAGIYGLITLLPQYFLEGRIGQNSPPQMSLPGANLEIKVVLPISLLGSLLKVCS